MAAELPEPIAPQSSPLFTILFERGGRTGDHAVPTIRRHWYQVPRAGDYIELFEADVWTSGQVREVIWHEDHVVVIYR